MIHVISSHIHLFSTSFIFQSLWDLVPMLAKLLSLLSGDLCLRQYVHYYWRDFPEICPANPDQAKTGQLTEGHLTGLNAPMGMRETQPPNIHQVKHFYRLLIPNYSSEQSLIVVKKILRTF